MLTSKGEHQPIRRQQPTNLSEHLPIMPLSQGAGAVGGAAAEEASGGEGGSGPGEHGSLCGAEPPPDDGAFTDYTQLWICSTHSPAALTDPIINQVINKTYQ